MSRIDESTSSPGETQVPGKPDAPEPVAPPDYDGHAEGEVPEAERDSGPSASMDRQPRPPASKGPTLGGADRHDSSAPSPDDGLREPEEAPVGGLEETRESDAMETTKDEAGLREDVPSVSRLSPRYDEGSRKKDRHGLESSNDLTTP